jgi:DNA-binding MarR family transcriptional regulator
MSVAKPGVKRGKTDCPHRSYRDLLPWILGRVTHAVSGRLAVRLAPLGVTLRGYVVLSAVAEDGAQTQFGLAQALGIDKSTMVVAVDDLEDKGLVRRRLSPSDRRVRLLELTQAGAHVLETAAVVIREGEAEALAELSQDEQDLLVGLLHRLEVSFVGDTPEPGSCV